MHRCRYCAAPTADGVPYCSKGCADAATWDTEDERETAFARDGQEPPDAA